MKEKELKKILMKPKMDMSMDDRIAENLLSYNQNSSFNLNTSKLQRVNKIIYKKSLQFISKAAAIVLVLAAVGGATVWAAGLLVKTYPVSIRTLSEEDLNDDRFYKIEDRENIIRKNFGGNEVKGPFIDTEGNILIPDDDGFIHFKDGSVFYFGNSIDKDRYEKDRKSGDEAFAELGLPNMIPDYIYTNYMVVKDGFTYSEYTIKDRVFKQIYVNFVPDYSSPEFADNSFSSLMDKRIGLTLTPLECTLEESEIILPDKAVNTIYTTKNGITCNIIENDNVSVFINYSSETIGNGHIHIEFRNIPIDKVKEILDTLPLIEKAS